MSQSLILAARTMASALFLLSALLMRPAAAEPLDSRFTYQGELRQSGIAANGQFDFEFQPFDAASGGSDVAPAQIVENVVVSNGLFSVELDFGIAPFGGDKVWLEVGVREGGSTGGFTGLLPRQAVTAAPYALHAQAVAPNSVGSDALIDGSVGAADIDITQVQRRVSGSCAVGSAIASIAAGGTVTCSPQGGPVVFKARGFGFGQKSLPAGPPIEADLWKVVEFNVGGGFKPATRRFVAPSAGYYYLHATISQSNLPSSSLFQIGFNLSGSLDYTQAVEGKMTKTSISGIFRLSRNQEVWVRMRNYTSGPTPVMDGTGSWFEGYKISD